MAIDPNWVEQHGLTQEEYERLLALLGREPNRVELGIFSVMWSEHCSYKSSKVHLAKLPTKGPRVIQGPGENAGAVEIGDGWVAVFKIESHNHPSFIEPYQGAATGVGGILRDIFTMGARPIALLNSLRFGSLESPKNRYLMEGVVAGIAGYGNCVGVPTVGGEITFNDIYNLNPLVNVFCLGIARKEKMFGASASGVGNAVIYVGSKTGRDGIHGATMASESFDDETHSKRPTVQVGDPFAEKLLLEACLEVMDRGLIVAIGDMGAAGLTSSTVEMASRAGTGIELDLSRVPQRETGMTPYEIMLSESQERMIVVASPDRIPDVMRVFEKWELDAAVIGRVTSHPRIVIKNGAEIVADLPIRPLTEEAPRYERPLEPPAYLDSIQGINFDWIPMPTDYATTLVTLLKSPSIGSKQWVYRQYDHMVRTNTVIPPGFEAALVRIKGTRKALALTLDGNSLYCLLNPYQGGMIAVCEAARNVVCSGARPLGATDCLNFGNPERKEVMWQFALCVEGIADACRHLEIPVVSGNVSFYNETHALSIYPTPIIGMVGLIEDFEKAVRPGWMGEGDGVLLLGETKEELGGTEYLRQIHSREGGFPPLMNLEAEKSLQNCCLEAMELGIMKSAHDCSEGGLAVALAEASILSPNGLGARIGLPELPLRPDGYLFGESQSRILVSVNRKDVGRMEALCSKYRVPMTSLGEVAGDRLTIRLKGEGTSLIDLAVSDLRSAWGSAIERYFEKRSHDVG